MNQHEQDDLRNLVSDMERRKWRTRPAKKMADVMSRLLAKRGYAQTQTAETCTQAWSAAVGDRLAKHTRPGVIRRGVLEVAVRNSATMQQLGFETGRILKRLQAAAPNLKIKKLKPKVAPVD